ncbi:lipopolysaccharide biosynthesis protein [Photobacterium phosphoreum]|uniref:lipopolysaccharide biosynthesis protein n=1 Tax=Photobacterium phosphoreum TaxID=659 RepID=UPI001E2E5D33|nr:lipopolysaccharide biosynthesis protein [Photobacterium phosphoreum]MCD9511825.1 oligosaccharide flippase family protein [Photobacterium phosphoreum]
MSDIKNKTINGLKWSAIERIATQAIQLVVMLLLGRMLGPKAFGLIGMVAVFIAISQTFVDGGFTNALIRKVDRNEADYATTFYSNTGVSLLCYIALFTGSPYIADFYNQPELCNILRILGLGVIFNVFAIVQRAKLNAEMDFKTLAKASFFSISISAMIAIIFSYLEYGVWSLVIQSLSFTILNVIFLNIYNPWWPKCSFSISSFRELFGFGSKILLSSFIDNIYYNIYQIIIGKLFSVDQLGWFSQAKNLASMPAMTLTVIIQRVTYPMMSNIQDDREALSQSYLLTLRFAAAVIFPLILGLGIIAKPLILLLLGSDWTESAKMMTLICIGFMVYPINSINANLLQVKGRSDLFLRIEIFKKILTTIILLISIPFGIIGICIGIIIDNYCSLFINTYYSERFSGISNRQQFKSISVIWILSVIASLTSSLWYIYLDNIISQLFLIVITAVLLYLSLIRIFQKDLFDYAVNVFFKKNNSKSI